MSIRVAVIGLTLLLQQLPTPFETPWFRKPTRVVAMPEGHRLTVPPGFSVNVFADNLQLPRFMALAPNGDVSRRADEGRCHDTLLRDASDGDGVAETRVTFARG